MKQFGSLERFCIRVLSPKMDPPVMVLVGAMLVFGEHLNLYQWIGVLLAVASFLMLSRSGKKEGIDFKHDKWIY